MASNRKRVRTGCNKRQPYKQSSLPNALRATFHFCCKPDQRIAESNLKATLNSKVYNAITHQIKGLTNRGRNLGILDFFGFESVDQNSFEQLNINYCSERIHQSYIQIVLKYQQDLYVREGLDWTKIDFYDNQSICEMMDKVCQRQNLHTVIL